MRWTCVSWAGRTGTLGGNNATRESELDILSNGELPHLTLCLFIWHTSFKNVTLLMWSLWHHSEVTDSNWERPIQVVADRNIRSDSWSSKLGLQSLENVLGLGPRTTYVHWREGNPQGAWTTDRCILWKRKCANWDSSQCVLFACEPHCLY